MSESKFTPLQRAAAIKLLAQAFKHAELGEEDPVIVAGVERNLSLGGKVWELAWLARVEAKSRARNGCSLRHKITIGAAKRLLEDGWEPPTCTCDARSQGSCRRHP